MPFLTKTFATLRDELLRDLKNGIPDADISADSDYFIRASSIASLVAGIHRDQAWIVRQIFPDTADTEYLELHARTRGLRRKSATFATGSIMVTGEPGSNLPAGSEIKRETRSLFTTEDAVIDDDGVINVRIQASSAGTQENTSAAMNGTLVSAPFGVDSTVIIEPLSGGTDDETDADLLARLLELIRRPPAGGNRHDYRRWALEVDGVTGAYVYPLRRGLGTVDVVIISGSGIAPVELIQTVKDYIEGLRPVTAKDTLILTATLKAVDFIIEITRDGITQDDAINQVTSIIEVAINRLEPGQPLIIAQISAQILTITGITDVNIILPEHNVKPTVDELVVEWIKVGDIQIRGMNDE
ncbi:baseplate J/gp47 family protein [Limnobaculum zhutongyuii]|uniref:Baseplate J/gp47 family protein n=1 Tax=Limnobaculum zhutongyuii TaxID=2498113 RepID=A0A411WH99_9GAMM|nr:baseplate J/gp47 family protein [Limnobaculum zhutongyuii]QBH95456.1 baseplate J/gp47 family protein [Limnobaculum zhutongyuii]TQS88855.1 baseplate J/gp47 family protein [Limnobaculum zhutongyuii]